MGFLHFRFLCSDTQGAFCLGDDNRVEWTTDHTSMTHRESQAFEYQSRIENVLQCVVLLAHDGAPQPDMLVANDAGLHVGGRRRSSARRASYERWCSTDTHTHIHTDRDRDRGTHTRHKTQDRDIDADRGTTQEAVGVFCWDKFLHLL